MHNLFADAAPTGAGLAIVGAILLVFFAVGIAVVYFVARTIIRSVRARRDPAPNAAEQPSQ